MPPTDSGSDDETTRTVRTEQSLSGMRKTIANRLQESYQEAVHVTVSREVDAETLAEAAANADDISVIDLILCALSDTLSEHPAFNATFEDGVHRQYDEQNVGIAVDIDDGLVTPVLANLESKTLPEIATERRELTERMQAGTYSMRDLRGGTFTVTNLGVLGVDSFTPIINPPEVAILGVGRLRERARPADDGDGVTFRRHIGFDLTFDHRVVDGADAARFLETLADHVENPDSYLDRLDR